MNTQLEAPSRRTLSALSLDAAIEIDRLERHQHANPEVLREFVALLGSSLGGGSTAQSAQRLNEDPIGVAVFVSALEGTDRPVSTASELPTMLETLLADLNLVAESHAEQGLEVFKRFCLSLHRALLSEAGDFGRRDEWVFDRDELLA